MSKDEGKAPQNFARVVLEDDQSNLTAWRKRVLLRLGNLGYVLEGDLSEVTVAAEAKRRAENKDNAKATPTDIVKRFEEDDGAAQMIILGQLKEGSKHAALAENAVNAAAMWFLCTKVRSSRTLRTDKDSELRDLKYKEGKGKPLVNRMMEKHILGFERVWKELCSVQEPGKEMSEVDAIDVFASSGIARYYMAEYKEIHKMLDKVLANGEKRISFLQTGDHVSVMAIMQDAERVRIRAERENESEESEDDVTDKKEQVAMPQVESAQATLTREEEDLRWSQGWSQQSAMVSATGDCYDFRDGNCQRGDSCRFSHRGRGGSGSWGGRGGSGGWGGRGKGAEWQSRGGKGRGGGKGGGKGGSKKLECHRCGGLGHKQDVCPSEV
jgi:hypothetical protein